MPQEYQGAQSLRRHVQSDGQGPGPGPGPGPGQPGGFRGAATEGETQQGPALQAPLRTNSWDTPASSQMMRSNLGLSSTVSGDLGAGDMGLGPDNPFQSPQRFFDSSSEDSAAGWTSPQHLRPAAPSLASAGTQGQAASSQSHGAAAAGEGEASQA